MIRIVVRSFVGLLLAGLLSYPVDWAIWRSRVAAGGGMARVTVREITVAGLKGGKSEYYINGATDVDCSVSLYPQAGFGACWWLRGHSDVTTQD